MASMFEVDPATPNGAAGAVPVSDPQTSSLPAHPGRAARQYDADNDHHTRAHADRLAEQTRQGSVDHSPHALARLIEGEIIPRMLVAHRSDPLVAPSYRVAPTADASSISAAERDAFIPLVLTQEVHALLANIDILQDRGVPLDVIYLDLLVPAARELGEYWLADLCDFVDVTMGLWRLQHVVHELGQRHARTPIEVRTNRRAYFSAAPGDQHSFGVVMVEDFFRRAGWQTASASTATFAGLAEIVAAEWFELIGLTVSYELHIESLAEIIAALRKVSKNPAVLVMVGGMIFAEQPGLAARVGADGTASDGKLAVLCAEKLLGDIVNPSNSASSRASR